MVIRRKLDRSGSILDHSEATAGKQAHAILCRHSLIFIRFLFTQLHRQRVRFMAEDQSGLATPVTPLTPRFSAPGSQPGSRPVSTIQKSSDPSQITEAHFQ